MPNQLPPVVTCRQLLQRVLPFAAVIAACGDLEGDVGPDVPVEGSTGSDSTSAETTSGPGQGVTTSASTNSGGGETSAGSTASTSSSASSGTEQPPSDCNPGDVQIPKRLVRLTFNQVARSLGTLLGDAFATDVATTFELPSAYERTFPPLNNPREGSVIIDAQWQTGDAIAQAAGEYVKANFAQVTQCGEAPTRECAQTFADAFAERAFRQPLSAEELTSFRGVFAAVMAEGGSIEEATQYSVYAALSAPQFLYRTEFGQGAATTALLSPYETASMLSYFVTDGPPDSALLQAAASDELKSPEQIGAHVDRLLQTPVGRLNLQSAMFAYFGISTLNTIVIDPEVAPQFTEGLRASMMRETELFINDTLWNGSVADLMTSRRSFVNEGLADLYGVTFPPAGVELDADGFGPVMLPENRSGILTQPGYLTTRSSPEEPSVVRRGLLINASLLCATNPPFPESQAETIEEVSASLEQLSEREKAEYRAGSTDCGGCHKLFDAYGLALDNFDVIGAYRDADDEGRPIDPTVTLPAVAGGATVTSPAQLAHELADSGAFTACVAKNLLAYALAEGSTLTVNSCATQTVSQNFEPSDQSFGALVKEVAKSSLLTTRTAVEAQ